MKKILLTLVLISFLAGPMIALAQPPAPVASCTMRRVITGTGITCPSAGAVCPYDSTVFTCVICCLIDKIYTVTDWFFIIALGLAIIFALWGGFLLMTAAGEVEKVATGRRWVMWAMIGVAVALLAKAIPALVRALMII